MNFVNKKFEVETLTAFRIRQLGGMTEGAVVCLSTGTSMRLERIMAVITRGGLNQSASDLDPSPCRDKLKERVRDIPTVRSCQLTADDVRRPAVIIRRKRCLESVSKDPRARARKRPSPVIVGLARLGQRRLSLLAFVDIFLSRNLGENIVVIVTFSTLTQLDCGDRETDAVSVQILET